MSKTTIPSLLRLLDLLVDAFHLDEDVDGRRNELNGRGKYQAYLTGRSLDLGDEKLSSLLHLFSKSLLASGVFPALRSTLREDLPANAAPLVQGYLGEALSVPRLTGDLARDMSSRLQWLLRAHEHMLGQCRAQDAAARCEPHFLLLPLARFGGHHLTIALALLHWGRFLDLEHLPESIELSWAMANPAKTPMRLACEALGLSQADALRRVEDSPRLQGVDDKTLANLWHGGDDHPRLETLQTVLAALHPTAEATRAAALPQWRRWYGLRHIAWQMAQLWNWEVVGGLVGDILFGAIGFARSLEESALTAKDRKAVASVGVWAGWRLLFGRYAFGSAVRRIRDDLSPIVRHDYAAIGEGKEHLRLQQCLQVSSGGSELEHELRRRGKDAASARREALHLIQLLQCDVPQLADQEPLLAFQMAAAKEDWPRAEVAARQLVERRPDILGNHVSLASVLAVQNKFDQALTAVQRGVELHSQATELIEQQAHILLARGDVHGSGADFAAARDLLATPAFGDHWGAQLALADCHFALGDWAAAQAACDRCVQLHDECGEAYAIDSICSLRLGDTKRSNQCAEYATRRGAGPFLHWLREHDLRGGLGSQNIVPPPRWHRMRYG